MRFNPDENKALEEARQRTTKDLLSLNINKQNKSDAIAATRSFIRHDSQKLKHAIIELLNN